METLNILQNIINERGLNIHKLSKLSGISYNTLYSIVKRKSKNISYGTIIKLSNALEMSPNDLFEALTNGGKTV